MRGSGLFPFLMLSLTALGEELPGFSFDYQITGDRSIAPFQVFDDGVSTFLQFRDPSKLPSIFIREANGSKLVVPRVQGTYQRIDGVVSRLELVSDRKTATIISTRKTPLPAAKSAATTSAPTPPASSATVASAKEGASSVGPKSPEEDTRAQLEQLRRMVVDLQQRVSAIASTAPKFDAPAANSTPAAAAASASVAAPIPPVTREAAGDASKQVFVFEAEAGQRLSEAVRRFAAGRGMQLDWDTGGADFEIRHAFRIAGGSLEEVLYGALSPFKLSAVAHRGNRVLAVSRGS